MFAHAKQNRAFEDIIFQIQESILQGTLKVGDKLPSETQLSEIFKVSRGTLREALRALEQKKLIQIKTGVKGGSIICPVNETQMSESLDLLLRYRKVTLRELAEFREEVEGCLASKAAQKATKEDLKQLTGFLDSIKNKLKDSEFNWDEIIREDRKFHLHVAHIAGNRVFEAVLHTVYDTLNQYTDQFLPKNSRIMERSYRDLCKIVKAIRKRDCHKAQILAQSHVKSFNLIMEKREKHVSKKTLHKNK